MEEPTIFRRKIAPLARDQRARKIQARLNSQQFRSSLRMAANFLDDSRQPELI